MLIRSKYELEAMARLTLGKFFDYPIETLKCADKPDLQDEVHSYGIEVVQDCYQNEKKAESILMRYGMFRIRILQRKSWPNLKKQVEN